MSAAIFSTATAWSRAEIEALLDALERGERRAALPDPAAPGGWRADPEVKAGILAAFRIGADRDLPGPLPFRDRDTLLPPAALPPGVRVVPGGSAIRRGARVCPGVVVMAPAYVNVGAFIGAGTMVDSHALVGSCAQVGEGVHLSAAAQLGGVLEPAGALPVIIEDGAFIGGNCGVYEGTLVGERAVLAAGVILTASSVVYDLVNGRELRADPAAGIPLRIPRSAVVVPGGRPAPGEFARARGLSLAAPLIVKYRDARTDARTALESALRRESP